MNSGRPVAPPTESSILEILDTRAFTLPARKIFSFLGDGEAETSQLTYSQLQVESRAVASRLQSVVQPGDRVVLLYPPGLEFITAFFGCLYAGAIAVPTFPPRLELLGEGLIPLANIAKNCEPKAVLAGGAIAESIYVACRDLPELANATWILTDQVASHESQSFQPVSIQRKTAALIQYTSGSTGSPKGVVISHGNILENQYLIQLSYGHRTAERPGEGVCWVPFYHDLGLFGNVIHPIYVDGPCVFMSPLHFLQRPYRWLKAIDTFGAHTSTGPNFAYDLCVQRISEEQKATLDLSRWEVAMIGAEPVSALTLERFVKAFASCGFEAKAFTPSYGLAEATLLVSTKYKNAPLTIRQYCVSDHEAQLIDEHPESESLSGVDLSAEHRLITHEQTLVGCGRTGENHDLRVVNPQTCEALGERQVGEIWFRGPSVAQGYWNSPELTAETFQGRLSTDLHEGSYLRTGDLGFIDQGELFVCGRLKDLIVIRGRNHYPQDIENTICQLHEAFRPNSGAAFGCLVDRGERLVVLQEIDRQTRSIDLVALTRIIRQAVAEKHQLQIDDLVFLRNGSLPKTTSGKIRRRESQARYLKNQLVVWKASERP